jgi:hypothetical protein
MRVVLPKSSVLLCVFYCEQKDSMQAILVKKCFLFTVRGSVCRVKRFTAGSINSFKDEEVVTEVRKWLRQQSKDCGFRRASKAMGHLYQCWWRICREINVVPSSENHIFYVVYPFVTYLRTLRRSRFWSNRGATAEFVSSG